MIPAKPLPISDEFASPEAYVEALLDFVKTSDIFQILCGGVHVLDFFTSEPDLFQTIVPAEWQPYLLAQEPMELLDFLLRDDLDAAVAPSGGAATTTTTAVGEDSAVPPASLLRYVRDIRRLSLRRSFTPREKKLPVLPRHIAVGMNVKKVHEVTNFADYVDKLVETFAAAYGQEVTHLIDFGSGQNYLGRTLASPPYSRHIIAVEGREHNIAGAKVLDVLSGLAEKEKVMRNRKVYQQLLDSKTPVEKLSDKAISRLAKSQDLGPEDLAGVDLRPWDELETKYHPREDGKGSIHYVEGRLETGDLTHVLEKVRDEVASPGDKDLSLMAVSIHSCGNLSHYGIRSMILNPSIRAVAIVGCCYNLLTEKLGPPSYKLPYMRPSMQAINGRVVRESDRRDPQGFPMSEQLSEYKGGVRLNITARMMACQAPENWTAAESSGFFTRHYFRTILQKIFLDKGVISRVYHDKDKTQNGEGEGESGANGESPFNMSTNPVIIGSLRKHCYTSFNAYVRGAIKKLTTNSDYSQYGEVVARKMGDMTDEEIAEYEERYERRKREVSVIWSLMAFSAVVAESLIVTDRWLFLREHPDVVRDCWVETVFDYGLSPRNLVIVGIKK